jgi:uncharacterized protein (TIGR02678 family)
MDSFWILRKDDDELYALIKHYEHQLRDYFKTYFRFKLLVENDFAKVEKFQVSPQFSVGISEFHDIKDYTMFYCFLAYLDGKGERQFTISDVCEAIVSYYPKRTNEDGSMEEERIIWKEGQGYRNRLVLIRVLKEAKRRNLIEVIDRNIEDFRDKDSNDALLRGTGLVRYFIRNYGFNITQTHSLPDIINFQENQEGNLGTERRHYLYRKLFLEPVTYKHELEEADFDYIKQYGHHIQDHAESYYDMSLELYASTVMLVKKTTMRSEVVFPSDNAESNLMVQFATLLRDMVISDRVYPEPNGVIFLTGVDLDKIIRELVEKKSEDWTTGLKKLGVSGLKELIVRFLREWKFAYVTENGRIQIYDTLGRFDEKQ